MPEKEVIGPELRQYERQNGRPIPGCDFYCGYLTRESANTASEHFLKADGEAQGANLSQSIFGYQVAEPKQISIGSGSLFIPRVTERGMGRMLFILDGIALPEFRRGYRGSVVEQAEDD